MDVYAQIRKLFSDGTSIRKIAKILNISRNTVKKYCEGCADPFKRKTPRRQATSMTEDVVVFIKECLEQDAKENVKKQRHTARRIFQRLKEERGYTGGESTIRRKVHELKAATPKVFIPLQFDPGEAMQIDWGVASVYIQGIRQEVNLFCARLCYSCKPIVLAYRRQNEESFLDALQKTFMKIGGVPKKVIFDNAKVAVREGFGFHAVKQKGYSVLSAHYAFEAAFCNAGEGHEKGLVEGLVGLSRRSMLTPLPKVNDIEELNAILDKRCEAYSEHRIANRSATVGAMFETERSFLRPLPKYPLEVAKHINVRVDAVSTVRFQGNKYSVPTAFAGRQVAIKASPETIEVYQQGEKIAQHTRLYGRDEQSLQLAHYLPLLEKRWRAALDAAPVKQNLSREAFEALKENYGNCVKMKEILYREAGLPLAGQADADTQQAEKAITDPVKVRTVDLHVYDSLASAC